MRLLNPITFDEVIATYLQEELSGRFKQDIETALARANANTLVVKQPNLTSVTENALRRRILAAYRAYVFDQLPDHVKWYRAILAREEVARIRYINYSYWNEVSNQTRLPVVAAEEIRSGRVIYGQSTAGFMAVAEALREGAEFPELIVVAESPEADLTVYEGHVRLTAYMLAPECLPEEFPVIVGFAPECGLV